MSKIKIITISLLTLLIIGGGFMLNKNENLGSTDKKLKASSNKILDYKKIKDKKGKDIVMYSYISDVEVGVGTLNHKGKKLTEVVEKREKNARIYQDGEETVAQIYGSNAFLKDSGLWKHTEVATSTITDFEAETDYTVATSKKHTLLGIRTAWAASPETIFSASGDGDIYGTQSTWDAIHDAASGDAADTVGNLVYVYSQKLAATFRIRRGFFVFNTKIIPDDATIVASTSIYAMPNAVSNNDNDGDDFIVFAESERAATSTLAVGDFSQVVTDIDNIIELTKKVDLSGLTADSYKGFDLNSTGFTTINKTGWTEFMGLEGHDVVDSPIATVVLNGVYFYSSDEAGTAKDPYIVITYTTPVVTESKKYYAPNAMFIN